MNRLAEGLAKHFRLFQNRQAGIGRTEIPPPTRCGLLPVCFHHLLPLSDESQQGFFFRFAAAGPAGPLSNSPGHLLPGLPFHGTGVFSPGGLPGFFLRRPGLGPLGSGLGVPPFIQGILLGFAVS